MIAVPAGAEVARAPAILRAATAFVGAAAAVGQFHTGLGAQAQPQQPRRGPVPGWLYPSSPPAGTAEGSVVPLRVPGSSARYTARQILNEFAPPDWHGASHPRMPPVVARGRRPAVPACAYCHMPNGAGRPETAALAGLRAAYIVAQVAAFRGGTRRSASPAFVPAAGMQTAVAAVTDSETRSAARYFSRLRYPGLIRVIETDRVPQTRAEGGAYVPVPGGGTEALGVRIIEVPANAERFERRDDAVPYIAYVPPGSRERGAAIAARGGPDSALSCVKCHGQSLRGTDVAPSLAGRHPMYLVRQLIAFRTGARAGTVQPMRAVAAHLDLADMVAVAAYAASLNP